MKGMVRLWKDETFFKMIMPGMFLLLLFVMLAGCTQNGATPGARPPQQTDRTAEPREIPEQDTAGKEDPVSPVVVKEEWMEIPFSEGGGRSTTHLTLPDIEGGLYEALHSVKYIHNLENPEETLKGFMGNLEWRASKLVADRLARADEEELDQVAEYIAWFILIHPRSDKIMARARSIKEKCQNPSIDFDAKLKKSVGEKQLKQTYSDGSTRISDYKNAWSEPFAPERNEHGLLITSKRMYEKGECKHRWSEGAHCPMLEYAELDFKPDNVERGIYYAGEKATKNFLYLARKVEDKVMENQGSPAPMCQAKDVRLPDKDVVEWSTYHETLSTAVRNRMRVPMQDCFTWAERVPEENYPKREEALRLCILAAHDGDDYSNVVYPAFRRYVRNAEGWLDTAENSRQHRDILVKVLIGMNQIARDILRQGVAYHNMNELFMVVRANCPEHLNKAECADYRHRLFERQCPGAATPPGLYIPDFQFDPPESPGEMVNLDQVTIAEYFIVQLQDLEDLQDYAETVEEVKAGTGDKAMANFLELLPEEPGKERRW